MSILAGGTSRVRLEAFATRNLRSASNLSVRRRGMLRRRRPILPAPFVPNPWAWSDRGLYAAWLGHSTVLLRIDGFNILTDPVFSRRVGFRVGCVTVGLKRIVTPALGLEHLPRIDLVLLSHAHFDHFDRPTLRALEGRGTTVVTASRTSDLDR